MLSYHSSEKVKATYVNRFAAHRAADEVVQGRGYDDGHGCFIGCTLDAYDHSSFRRELGWPIWLAHLADTIFEGLSKAEAPAFGSAILEAVPVGVDLEKMRVPFLIALMQRNLQRLEGNQEPYARECSDAIQEVMACLSAESVAKSAWSAAESAAMSAAWAARSEWSAAQSAARSAAESAAGPEWSARSARSAAESAARSPAESAAELAARWIARWTAESAAWAAMSPGESSDKWVAGSARSAAGSAAGSDAGSMEETRRQRDDLLELIVGLSSVK